MILTHTDTQVNKKGQDQTTLEIKVDYDPATRTVEDIVSVRAFNHENDSFADITAIFKELHENALELMVACIDWPERYRDYQNRYAVSLIENALAEREGI